MKPQPLLTLLYLTLLSLLAACSQLDTPLPGTYRAYATLRGGEVPVLLEIGTQGATTLQVRRGDALVPATAVTVHNGRLRAQLPDDAGTLDAKIGRGTLRGELRLLDAHGKAQVLPFAADLDKSYRFVEQPGTDNIDVAGDWLLEAISPEHFAEPVRLQLQQRFDAVDGQLQLPDGRLLTVLGQASGDEVFLSAIGHGHVLLLKGKFDSRGELHGESWHNLSNATPWAARRMSAGQSQALTEAEDPTRRVALPWAIPVE